MKLNKNNLDILKGLAVYIGLPLFLFYGIFAIYMDNLWLYYILATLWSGMVFLLFDKTRPEEPPVDIEVTAEKYKQALLEISWLSTRAGIYPPSWLAKEYVASKAYDIGEDGEYHRNSYGDGHNDAVMDMWDEVDTILDQVLSDGDVKADETRRYNSIQDFGPVDESSLDIDKTK